VRIYLAAPYNIRERAIGMMHELQRQGHEVTSRWLKEVDDESDATARKDLEDIDAAEMLVLWQPDGWEALGTGGRHFECGYAFAKGKQLTLVGKRANAFHQLYDFRVIERIEDL
jgi:nucleoside 2-deoxyribosyltransferase